MWSVAGPTDIRQEGRITLMLMLVPRLHDGWLTCISGTQDHGFLLPCSSSGPCQPRWSPHQSRSSGCEQIAWVHGAAALLRSQRSSRALSRSSGSVQQRACMSGTPQLECRTQAQKQCSLVVWSDAYLYGLSWEPLSSDR